MADAPFTATADAPRPGRLFDTTRWRLALPVPDPAGRDAVRNVAGAELAEFTHPLCFFADLEGWTHHIAPVRGHATGPAGAARCDLRELNPNGTEAGWDLAGDADHVLAATMAVDLHTISGRREAIVAMVHAGTPTPPLYLGVNQNGDPGVLVLFVRGRATIPLLAEVGRDAVFSWRMAVTGVGVGRRLYVWAALGEQLPVQPAYAHPVAGLAPRGASCYFQVGVYNREPVAGNGTGKARLRHKNLALTSSPA